jgi:hypothetical protein
VMEKLATLIWPGPVSFHVGGKVQLSCGRGFDSV